MTQKQIDNARLLLRFMSTEPEVLENDLKKAGTLESTHYHDDYNELMAVVRKLQEVEFEPDNHINITIGPSNYCRAFPSHGTSFEFIGEESTTIACVYKVVVELVKMIREQGYAI